MIKRLKTTAYFAGMGGYFFTKIIKEQFSTKYIAPENKMVFSSPVFLFFFLPVTLGIYYAAPARFKNFILFLSGLAFYAWGEPVYVLVMILSTAIDYTAGRIIDRFNENKTVRKLCLIVSVAMNLSLLGVFKYSGFAIDSLNSLFSLSVKNPNLPLPIGISFFTFQSMSYTIDLYRGNIKVQKNFIDFGAFVTMFPQIVAGPIVLYEDVEKQLKSRTVSVQALSDGVSRFICGLAKKVLIANGIGELWTSVKAADFSALPALDAWLGILAFTLQIYFDFSGYSDMAIGLGKMIGFDFPENFRYPYMSTSITDFWRRWHMTLGGWFRSYVYIPLGGNRKGRIKTIRNLLIVWFLTGLWHGAGVNFIMWGLYYGVILILEKFVYGRYLEKLPNPIKRFYSLIIVIFGWVLFELDSAGSIAGFIGSMFGSSGAFTGADTRRYIHNYLFVFAAAVIGCTDVPEKIYLHFNKKYPKTSGAISVVLQALVFAAVIAYLVNSSYNPFLYFNF